MNNHIQPQNQESDLAKPQVSNKTKKIISIIDKAYEQIRQHIKTGSSLNFINRISLNLEQQKIQRSLANLVNGYIIIKHSEATKQPHTKFFYISEDYRFLCWKSVDKNDEKMIELRKIELIIQDREVGQFRRSNTMKSNKGNCFIIMCEVRNLQIQCRSQQQAEKIVQQLEQAIKNSRRMHLSYRF